MLHFSTFFGSLVKETEALLALLHTYGLGPVKAKSLIEHFGSAHSALQAPASEIERLPKFGKKISLEIANWDTNDSWKKDLDLVHQHNVKLISYTNPSYPQPLLRLSNHPLLLYCLGNLSSQDEQSIAIIGTRNASIYGREMAEKISQDLTSFSFTVVSGLARGIDTCAHQGALKRGRTIAFIGSGLAQIYPSENEGLAKEVAQRGAVLSELPMYTKPEKRHFPQRNRLVSASTQGAFLVEAPEKSGAMITMETAQKQGKKLFALPGRVDGPSFRGNHLLIKQGVAQLVEGAQDIAKSFNRSFSSIPDSPPTKRPPTPDELKLLNQMPDEESSIDELAYLTKLPVMKLNVLLISLVLKKWVKEFPGKLYKKL